MNTQPTPEEARELLDKAERAASVSRGGASWPQIAALFGLGGASSLALPAIANAPDGQATLPIVFTVVWISATSLFAVTFGRSVKRGFGQRWGAYIGVWAVAWVVAILGISSWFEGQAWFVWLMSLALTAITLTGAWIEACR